jgi:hypothetical protein
MPLHADRSRAKITLPRTKSKAESNDGQPSSSVARPPFSSSLAQQKDAFRASFAASPRYSLQRTPLNDRRLPPVGAHLSRQIKGRACECLVEEGGIRYAGRLYSSLSRAASAAAKDHGLDPSQNGYAFWRIQPYQPCPSLETVERQWVRYESAVARLLSRGIDGRVQMVLLRHIETLRATLAMRR